jgi:signal transduction histidine kinase
MKRLFSWLQSRLHHLPAAFLLSGVVLRALLSSRGTPQFLPVMAALLVWVALFLVGPHFAFRSPGRVHPHLGVETSLALLMIGLSRADYFANLLVILSMQAMQHLTLRQGVRWIALFSLLMAYPLMRIYGLSEGTGFWLLYSAGNAFLGSYALASRRAQEARAANRNLADRLEQANRELQEYALRLEQLAAARERHHLARELHDSVTQTVFSLTLASQSTLLLLERDRARVPEQLDHITRLAQETLAQMQLPIAELRPLAGEGLESRLRRHLEERHLPQGLTVSVIAQGSSALTADEEQGLFAIAREALNNVIKHARATRAIIQLCLEDPPSIEVRDDGLGFSSSASECGLGLPGMGERAAEIGWTLEVVSAPGQGTCVRAARKVEGALTP